MSQLIHYALVGAGEAQCRAHAIRARAARDEMKAQLDDAVKPRFTQADLDVARQQGRDEMAGQVATLREALESVWEHWPSDLPTRNRFYAEALEETESAARAHDEKIRREERERCCADICGPCRNGDKLTTMSDDGVLHSDGWCEAEKIRARAAREAKHG